MKRISPLFMALTVAFVALAPVCPSASAEENPKGLKIFRLIGPTGTNPAGIVAAGREVAVGEDRAVPSEPPAAPVVAIRRPEVRIPRLADLESESNAERRALSEFLEFQGPVRLQRPEGSFTFDIPISPRMEVISAEAEVHYTNSISLREDISQLALYWQDAPLAQVPLLQKAPSGRIRESLPGAPFESGYLELRVDVAQHYARNGECEDPSSPVLWTQIDPHESWIAMDYRLRPLDPVLTDIGELIDPRLWDDYELTIVTTLPAAATDHQLRWGASVSQKAALLLEYKPLKVNHAAEIEPSGDHVVIGTRNELSGILPDSMLAEITESFIGIYPHPGNAAHFLFVLSGFETGGVDRAVDAFLLGNEALPAVPTMDVGAVELPDLVVYEFDRTLLSNESVDFSELGFETKTHVGMSADLFEVKFSIPPDYYAPENAFVQFRLHFAHGASLRKDSVLNVLLNGKFESAIHLKEADGAVYRDYLVDIPLRSFKPGRNRIEFNPVMNPQVSGHCEMISEENLLLTLFDDSSLKMPAADHYVRMPDLQLFARTAFPATIDPFGEGFTIHVASMDSETMASAWMLAGKMAQTAGQPLLDMEVTMEVPAPDRHWIAVGPIEGISEEFLRKAPVQFGPDGRIPSVLVRVPGERMGMKAERRRVAGHQTSVIRGSSSAGNRGVAMQFQSPFADDKTGMLVTAEDRVTLRQRVSELIEPGIWDGLKGDTMVWYGDGVGLRSQRLGDSFYLGDSSFATVAAYHLSARPWIGVGLAVIGVFLLALFVKRTLAKFQRRQHGPGVEGSEVAA